MYIEHFTICGLPNPADREKIPSYEKDANELIKKNKI